MGGSSVWLASRSAEHRLLQDLGRQAGRRVAVAGAAFPNFAPPRFNGNLDHALEGLLAAEALDPAPAAPTVEPGRLKHPATSRVHTRAMTRNSIPWANILAPLPAISLAYALATCTAWRDLIAQREFIPSKKLCHRTNWACRHTSYLAMLQSGLVSTELPGLTSK